MPLTSITRDMVQTLIGHGYTDQDFSTLLLLQAKASGIELAYQIAREQFVTGGVNRVILATDGDFNVGITDFEDLKKLIQEKRKTGISLTTLSNQPASVEERIGLFIHSFVEAGSARVYIDGERIAGPGAFGPREQGLEALAAAAGGDVVEFGRSVQGRPIRCAVVPSTARNLRPRNVRFVQLADKAEPVHVALAWRRASSGERPRASRSRWRSA